MPLAFGLDKSVVIIDGVAGSRTSTSPQQGAAIVGDILVTCTMRYITFTRSLVVCYL